MAFEAHQDQSSQSPVIILLLGLSGVGKTFFISNAIKTELESRQTLGSVTSQVKPYFLRKDGFEIILYDTPGFENSSKDDSEVLSEIVELVREINRQKNRISGIIYLHRITDNRITGSTKKNFEILYNLCGERFFPHLTLVTTMWTELEDKLKSEGDGREEQLVTHYWKEMIDKGARPMRFMSNPESALDIVANLVRRRPQRGRVVPDLQRQILGEKLPLLQSGAGRVIYEDIKRKLRNYDQSIARNREECMELQQEMDSGPYQERQDKGSELKQLRMEADRLLGERTRLQTILHKSSVEGPGLNTPNFSLNENSLDRGTRPNFSQIEDAPVFGRRPSLDHPVQQRRSYSEGWHSLEPGVSGNIGLNTDGAQSGKVRRQKSTPGESLTASQLPSPESNAERNFSLSGGLNDPVNAVGNFYIQSGQQIVFQTSEPGNRIPEPPPAPESVNHPTLIATMSSFLHKAVLANDETTANSLLEAGANVNEREGSGNTALHLASQQGSESMTQFLLSRGADVNAMTMTGQTPLHLAAESGHCLIAELLLQHGADINASDADGEIPIQRAFRGGSRQMVKLLQNHGSSINWDAWGKGMKRGSKNRKGDNIEREVLGLKISDNGDQEQAEDPGRNMPW